MKILYENTKTPVNQVWITFPVAENDAVKQMLALTKGHEAESNITYRIAAVDSPIQNLKSYLTADMPFNKLSELAEKIRNMSREEQIKYSGILDCCSISKIEDVLEAADCLEMYDYFPNITCSKELGGYLVENGIMEFPREVWPYLDYSGIGEEYYANHSCAYTRFGLVCRKEEGPTLGSGQFQEISMQ